MFVLPFLLLTAHPDCWLPDYEFDAYRFPQGISFTDSSREAMRQSFRRHLELERRHGSVGVMLLATLYIEKEQLPRALVAWERGGLRLLLITGRKPPQ